MGKPLLLKILKICAICFSGVVFIITIGAAYGGHINPETFATPSVLALFFPYLAILTIAITICWIISRNIWMSITGGLTLLICIKPLGEVIPFGSKKEVAPGDETFSIISWNVLHTDDIREPDYPGNRAVEYMVNSNADIICLTELYNFSSHELKKASPQLIDSLVRAYPFQAGLNETDIKVLSKYPVDRLGYSLIKYGNHSFDFYKVHFPKGRTVVVAMVHLYSYGLSTKEREVVTDMKSVDGAKASVKELKGSIMHKLKDAFRKRAENATILREAIDEFDPIQPLIVCGDFNDVPSSWTYNLIKGDDLKDAYAETNMGPAWTYNLHRFYFHIDQMLYRGELDALSLEVGKINTSDHYPLVGTFKFTSINP